MHQQGFGLFPAAELQQRQGAVKMRHKVLLLVQKRLPGFKRGFRGARTQVSHSQLKACQGVDRVHLEQGFIQVNGFFMIADLEVYGRQQSKGEFIPGLVVKQRLERDNCLVIVALFGQVGGQLEFGML